jgi:hypothetical protein
MEYTVNGANGPGFEWQTRLSYETDEVGIFLQEIWGVEAQIKTMLRWGQ